jgi:hypothetical protein
MLGTAFLDKLYRQSPKTKKEMRAKAEHLKTENKVWSYVGRFITGFSMVEYQVNQLCDKLLGRSYAAAFLTYTLDLRKKVELISVVLRSKDLDESKMLKRVHELHDIRNIIAHWPFSEDSVNAGLWTDFMDRYGHLGFKKPRAGEKDNLIEYSELDSYDADAKELYDKLDNLINLVEPIDDLSDDLLLSIEAAISSSENVLRFPSKLKDDQGEAAQ